MAEQDPRLIEAPVRLSHSKLWKIQRNFFTSMGVEAWKDKVPFYISSNAFIGHRYALLVVNVIRDWCRIHSVKPNTPFYILELGSGTGKFSFYVLKALKALLKQHPLDNIKFCYIISDVVEKNIKFCQKNSAFKEYIDNKELDFAIFNAEDEQDFYLLTHAKKYSEINSPNPLIIFANYTFDCLKHDEFEYDNGNFKEVRIGLRSRYKNFDIEKSLYLNEIQLNFENSDINIDTYYDNPILTNLLKDYEKSFCDKRATITMPLGAFQFVENMSALTNKKFFMIAGDKGISVQDNFPLLTTEYSYSFDGCFSFIVNFHALGHYLQKLGGDFIPTHNYNNFKVNLFSHGLKLSDCYDTIACFENHLEQTGPDEYCYLFDELVTSAYRFDMKGIISFLRLSEWDPDAYRAIHDRLIELLPGIRGILLEDIHKDIHKVREKIYPINENDDIYILLGNYFQIQGRENEALDIYFQSITVFGDTVAPHNNIAMIYEKQKNVSKALFHYQKSYEIDPKNKFAKRKMLQLSDKPYLAVLLPILKGLGIMILIGLAIYLIKLH